jgi:NAD-dependent SIR2 family protein deacetylase
MKDLARNIDEAAKAIREADAVVIGAGAGMGVDSGLPDFRGDAGFWTAYPALYGKPFHIVANPHWFETDPAFAWGFYGHRYQMYQRTQPHNGFQLLHHWVERKRGGYFVFTSNVDGHFQKSGYAPGRLIECHGSINYLQCVRECTNVIWEAGELELVIDEKNLRCISDLPRCKSCGGLARPNILMFGDDRWLGQRAEEQWSCYRQWAKSIAGMTVVAIEMGAGLAIPTVRSFCEQQADLLIRINPREYLVTGKGISVPMGALAGIQAIDALLQRNGES